MASGMNIKDLFIYSYGIFSVLKGKLDLQLKLLYPNLTQIMPKGPSILSI